MHGVLEEIERIKAETRNTVIEECVRTIKSYGKRFVWAPHIIEAINELKSK